MYVHVSMPEGEKFCVVNPRNGKVYPACAADSDEGWIEMYVTDPTVRSSKTLGRVMLEYVTHRQPNLLTVKVMVPFDLVDRDTGEVVAECRPKLRPLQALGLDPHSGS